MRIRHPRRLSEAFALNAHSISDTRRLWLSSAYTLRPTTNSSCVAFTDLLRGTGRVRHKIQPVYRARLCSTEQAIPSVATKSRVGSFPILTRPHVCIPSFIRPDWLTYCVGRPRGGDRDPASDVLAQRVQHRERRSHALRRPRPFADPRRDQLWVRTFSPSADTLMLTRTRTAARRRTS